MKPCHLANYIGGFWGVVSDDLPRILTSRHYVPAPCQQVLLHARTGLVARSSLGGRKPKSDFLFLRWWAVVALIVSRIPRAKHGVRHRKLGSARQSVYAAQSYLQTTCPLLGQSHESLD